MNNDNNTPILSQVFDAWVDRATRSLMVAKPARVVRWDASLQLIDAQPLTKNSYYDETGVRQTEDWPVVTNVPVCFPGSGGYGMTFPITIGDMVLLVFSDRSLDGFLATGNSVDPGDGRCHHISDAIAIVGLRHFGAGRTGPLQNSPATACVQIGEDGADLHGVALGDKMVTWLTSFAAACTAAFAPNSVPAPLDAWMAENPIPAPSATVKVTP
jgi:hypothetical protein